jgi:ribosomal protein L37AE/L43A
LLEFIWDFPFVLRLSKHENPFSCCLLSIPVDTYPVMRKKTGTRKPTAKKIPLCPECGSSRVVRVLHAPITPSLQRSIKAGRAVLADREEWEGMTEWRCKSCGCDWSGNLRRFKRSGSVNATRPNK